MNILDPQTIAELIGADICPDEPFGPGAENILSWAERTFPGADPLDHYAFAEMVWTHTSMWSSPWGVLERERDKDRAARQLLRHARGDLGDPDSIVEMVTLDADGNFLPPAGWSREDWTRWMFIWLVQHYFRLDALDVQPASPALFNQD